MSEVNDGSKRVHRVFWTGGWDSTFRVLDILSSMDGFIQPYYLIYTGRPSTVMELKTINLIMDEIEQVDGWRGRVLRPQFFLADRYKYKNEPYASALTKVRQKGFLGTQYLCMAQFRDEDPDAGFEVGVPMGHGAGYRNLRDHIVVHPQFSDVMILGSEAPEELQILFKGYHLPLMTTTKKMMGEIAQAKGFLNLLERAWFCHFPVDGAACGVCPPCKVTIRAGLGYRVGEAGLERFNVEEARNPGGH